MNDASFDLLAIGRSSIDLYAREIGVPFAEIKSFAAYVGGCPTNISVGARRLGLRTALLTAVGDDPVGDFVLSFLESEGVATESSVRKAGRRTSAFLLGIEPPDRFSIVPYRENCADLELTIEDVRRAPLAESRLLLITGTGLSRQPSRAATVFAAEQARSHGVKVVLDLDYRPELWPQARDYESAVRSVMHLVEVAIGTHDEVGRALLSDSSNQAADDGVPTRELVKGIRRLIAHGLQALVMKRGAAPTLIFLPGGEMLTAATFPVDVLNVLGAGDAFASGFIYGYLKGWDWQRSARMGNACGALLVTRHGCANFMPYEREALGFIEERGGF